MSVPSIDPLPDVPTNIDPRFRYGTRAQPLNYQEATSRFYLPTQRSSRFWPLYYDYADNECFDALSSETPFSCSTDKDCEAVVKKWCNYGQSQYVKYQCLEGTCAYDFDAF